MKDTKAEISAVLDRFWDEMAIDLGEAPQNTPGLLGAALDSLSAVEVLLEIEAILGRSLPAEAVIRVGGYESKEDFIELLTGQVLEYISEHHHD